METAYLRNVAWTPRGRLQVDSIERSLAAQRSARDIETTERRAGASLEAAVRLGGTLGTVADLMWARRTGSGSRRVGSSKLECVSKEKAPAILVYYT